MVRLSVIATIASLVLAVYATPLNRTQSESDVSSESRLIDKRDSYKGRATWFNVGLGSCGKTDNDNDFIVALNPGKTRGHCDRWIHVKKGNKEVYAKVRDTCPSCAPAAIDLSPAAFKKLGTLDAGVLNITWTFTATGFKPPSKYL
ncbi:Non-catalytic module family EXPN protein [Auriculariales sp. MPI-PUGE-AT-0066]|nr:Non-catalytic module family EXPN protein [Auriculariales sp. MPI-PUGE-AT-0066]